jgi:hypothetical protein
MSGRRLQEWERQAAFDAYLAGEKVAAIALEFGCSEAAIRQYARRRGIPGRRDNQKREERPCL